MRQTSGEDFRSPKGISIDSVTGTSEPMTPGTALMNTLPPHVGQRSAFSSSQTGGTSEVDEGTLPFDAEGHTVDDVAIEIDAEKEEPMAVEDEELHSPSAAVEVGEEGVDELPTPAAPPPSVLRRKTSARVVAAAMLGDLPAGFQGPSDLSGPVYFIQEHRLEAYLYVIFLSPLFVGCCIGTLVLLISAADGFFEWVSPAVCAILFMLWMVHGLKRDYYHRFNTSVDLAKQMIDAQHVGLLCCGEKDVSVHFNNVKAVIVNGIRPMGSNFRITVELIGGTKRVGVARVNNNNPCSSAEEEAMAMGRWLAGVISSRGRRCEALLEYTCV